MMYILCNSSFSLSQSQNLSALSLPWQEIDPSVFTRPGPAVVLGRPPLPGSSFSLLPGTTPPACEPQSPQMQEVSTLSRLNLSQRG